MNVLTFIRALIDKGYDVEELVHMEVCEIRDLYEQEVLAKEIRIVKTVTASGGVSIKRVA